MYDFYSAGKTGNKSLIDFYIEQIPKLDIIYLTHLLMGVCEYGNLDLINYIIEIGEPIWDNNSWYNGLMGACLGGHLQIVKYMIQKGEKGANDFDRSIFESIYKGGSLEILEFMLKEYNIDWMYGLYSPCEGGYIDIIWRQFI